MHRQLLIFLIIFFKFLPQGTAGERIYVFGDSHSSAFSEIPGCIIKHTGSTTMHRIGRDGLSFLNLKFHGIEEDSTAIFVYGEIDVRCHIGKQRDINHRSLEEILETLSVNFINTILQNQALFEKLNCIVCSVVPPSYGIEHESYPIYGTLEDRINITKQLNVKLAHLCHAAGLLFLDVYDDYSYPDGSLNLNFSSDGLHIRVGCDVPIKRKLQALIGCQNGNLKRHYRKIDHRF